MALILIPLELMLEGKKTNDRIFTGKASEIPFVQLIWIRSITIIVFYKLV